MKNLTYMLFTLPLLLLTGCEKELMNYKGCEGVYFAVQYGASYSNERVWPYMPYSDFNFTAATGNTADVTLKVMITGPAKDYDRTFGLTVNPDSTTAVSGTDYVPVPTQGIIKAGELTGKVTVQLLRTQALQENILRLGLQLVSTDQLALSFPDWDAVEGYTAGTVIPHFDASQHTIRFCDMLEKPSLWSGSDKNFYGNEGGSWGAFSRKKLELICEKFELAADDFNHEETMPKALVYLISRTMSDYLIDCYNAKHPILEDDGRLMWFMYCPWESKVGTPWIPDDNFYN